MIGEHKPCFVCGAITHVLVDFPPVLPICSEECENSAVIEPSFDYLQRRNADLERRIRVLRDGVKLWREESKGWHESEQACSAMYDELHQENCLYRQEADELRTEAKEARARVDFLWLQVHTEIGLRNNPGGQRVGGGLFSSVPLGTLKQLLRELK